MVEAAGYVPVALSAEDYIELLPATWRAVNAYGIRIGHRTYDSDELGPLRRQPSGIAEKRNLWEVHHDPYDVSRVWVRNHHDGGWIAVVWKHLKRAPIPFGDLAWDHVRARMPKGSSEEEIADAVQALLVKASRGPTDKAESKLSRRDRSVAARTKTTARPDRRPPGPAAPVPEPDQAGHRTGPAEEGAEDPAPIAKVIPLGIFDAREEAKTWW